MKFSVIAKRDEKTQKLKEYVKGKITLEYDEENPDLVITIGGDGTVLRAVHKYIDFNERIIFFAVNTGHLGFFSNWTEKDIDDMCDVINKRSFETEPHSILEWRTNKEKGIAINEITIINPTATQVVDVYIDGQKFETSRGTGICVSTPNGSTAYNKSIGGPVIDPKLNCFIISEIASINSNAYRSLNSPLVLSGNHSVELQFYNALYLTSDHLKYEIAKDTRVKCRLARRKIMFGCSHVAPFIERIEKAFL